MRQRPLYAGVPVIQSTKRVCVNPSTITGNNDNSFEKLHEFSRCIGITACGILQENLKVHNKQVVNLFQ